MVKSPGENAQAILDYTRMSTVVLVFVRTSRREDGQMTVEARREQAASGKPKADAVQVIRRPLPKPVSRNAYKSQRIRSVAFPPFSTLP